MRIIFASNNQGKIKEVKQILKTSLPILTLEEVDFHDDIDEYGESFHINALIKAETISKLFPKDIVIADDSGLCVNHLDGAPGVYSARYAQNKAEYNNNKDSANINLLLHNMEGVKDRSAYFKTVICVIKPEAEPVFYSGSVHGEISLEKLGTSGFGYDPIFVYKGKTFAQMNEDEKNLVSHRKNALNKIKI